MEPTYLYLKVFFTILSVKKIHGGEVIFEKRFGSINLFQNPIVKLQTPDATTVHLLLRQTHVYLECWGKDYRRSPALLHPDDISADLEG